jgi:hypothetical protein
MTTANVLYLLMCLMMFAAFSATLAYYSRGPAKAAVVKRPTHSANLADASLTLGR